MELGWKTYGADCVLWFAPRGWPITQKSVGLYTRVKLVELDAWVEGSKGKGIRNYGVQPFNQASSS